MKPNVAVLSKVVAKYEAYAEADRQEDDEGKDEQDEDDNEDHFLVLPPHLSSNCHSCLVEFVCLESQIVRLVYQVLKILPSYKHLPACEI